jgi:hypothetical protein
MAQPMIARGFSIRIFLPDGTPDGLKHVEKSNWTGLGIVCPRSLFAEKKGEKEFARTGVYVLIGPSEESELPRIYVGQGDAVRPRLESHHAKKDFWTTAIFFVSKDEYLNRAHVQYLESELVRLAREAHRCELDNGTQPDKPSLSPADEADVQTFLDEMLLCFPVLGVTVFEKPAGSAPKQALLYLKAKDCDCRGYESAEGFVVLKGSRARVDEVPSIHDYLSDLRKTLVASGTLQIEGSTYVLDQDYAFNSPSTAAGVMAGRSANGRQEWHDKDGHKLKELQAQAVGQSADGPDLPET